MHRETASRATAARGLTRCQQAARLYTVRAWRGGRSGCGGRERRKELRRFILST